MSAWEALVSRLPGVMQGWLWFGVAWTVLCRLRVLGPDSRRLITVSLALTGTGALGKSLAVIVPFSAAQLAAIELATAGGLFAVLLAFSPQWAGGAPEITRRVEQRDAPHQ